MSYETSNEPVFIQVGAFRFKLKLGSESEADAVYKDKKAVRVRDRKKLQDGSHVRVVRIEKATDDCGGDAFITIQADNETMPRAVRFDDLH